MAKRGIKIVTPAEMRALEERVFGAGATAEKLMDEAGSEIARAVMQFCPRPGVCIAVFGKGHNGGDALVAARVLATAGWKTLLAPAFPAELWSPLTRKKFEEAGLSESLGSDPSAIEREARRRRPVGVPLVVLDGLLGIGASGPLRGPIADCAAAINRARLLHGATTVAIDIPTGLAGDSGAADAGCVIADLTVTIGLPKSGLLADSAAQFVGRLALGAVGELSEGAVEFPDDRPRVAASSELALTLPPRDFDSHKGTYGRVGILAGSLGMTGAATLCATACLRAGAGLITLYVDEEAYDLVASQAPVEVMVRPISSTLDVLKRPHDVLAVGPGLGQTRGEGLLELVQRSELPVVVDADALNIVSTRMGVLLRAEGPRLLTPHPGEMLRLDPVSRNRPRAAAVESFVSRYPCTLLLKGSRTLVGEKGRPLSYNSTGNPGMGSGGMGDVLTGVCAALLGRDLSLYDAARLGAWVCGRAAEIAIEQGADSHESLCATSVIANLGKAFSGLRERCY